MSLENNKAGKDDLTSAELVELGNEHMVVALERLFHNVRYEREEHARMVVSLDTPHAQKYDDSKANNYKVISILQVTYKIPVQSATKYNCIMK